MAVTHFFGWETGDLTELSDVTGTVLASSSVVKHGGYALRVNPTTTGTGYGALRNNLNGVVFTHNRVRFRIWFRVDTAPASGSEEVLSVGDATGSFGAEEFFLRLNSSRQLEVYDVAVSLVATGTTALDLNTWYCLGIDVTASDTGAYTVYIGDSVELSGTSDFHSAGDYVRILFGKVINRNSQSVDFYYDSFVHNDAAVPAKDIGIITRQPATGGSPTSDTWTKSSGSDAGALWDETPFNATNNCVSPGSGDPLAQTADLAAFTSTQTGHGSETLGASDTIVAAQATGVAKRSGGGGRTHELRYHLNGGAATDTAVTLTTSDGYARSAVITPTYSEISSGVEAGAEKSGGAAGQSMTVEDLWMMLAYVPSVAFFPGRPVLIGQAVNRGSVY